MLKDKHEVKITNTKTIHGCKKSERIGNPVFVSIETIPEVLDELTKQGYKLLPYSFTDNISFYIKDTKDYRYKTRIEVTYFK